MEAPSPVVFKSIGRFASNSEPAKGSLKMAFFNLEYHQPKVGNGYFLLASHSDPSRPIKLFRSAMVKLHRQLIIAIDEARKLEQQQQPLTDNDQYDCGVINSYNTMTVRLVISTFHGFANIWLRLYSENEMGQVIPTKIAVRFSPHDDLAALEDFISKSK